METEHWNSSRGYILAMLGSAIGFANLLGFGSQCYRNGGGAFLIPFFIALFILGIPMLMLEGIVGQMKEQPLVTAYGKVVGRAGKTLGWLAVIAVTTIGAFYTVLTGWSIAYTYFAATGSIPSDTAHFFTRDFLQVSNGWALSLPVFISTLGVSGLGWYVISRNIQDGIEKWCSLFLPMLAAVVAIFVGVVSFLPGASIGFIQYLKPNFSKLFDVTVWRDVFGQLFFSLSLGLGIVVGYSRHTDKKTNIRQAMITVALADFFVSFICGFIIFGCLGYMAHTQEIAFSKVANTCSVFDIGYVIFPVILQSFGPILSQVVGAIFFFSVFIAGFTGVFSIVESIVGNIQVEFDMVRKKAVTIAMGIILAIALPFCTGNGTMLIDALEPMVMGNNMLIGAIAQIVVFMYICHESRHHPIWNTRFHLAYHMLRYVSLSILVITLVTSLQLQFELAEAWLLAALAISVVLAYKGKHVHI